MKEQVTAVITFLLFAISIDAQDALKIESATSVSGQTGVQVRILADNSDSVAALEFAAQYPPELSYSTADNAAAVEGTLLGSGNLDAEWIHQGCVEDGADRFFYMGAIIDFSSPFENRVLAPGTDQHVFNVFFDVTDGLPAGQELIIDLRNDLGDPVIRPVFTVLGQSIVPEFQDGSITIVTPPSISSISPARGAVGGGTEVTITGTNFTADAEILLGGQSLVDTSFVNATTIIGLTLPGTEGPADLVITNSLGTDTLPGAFTYAAPPEINSIEPAVGNGSQEVLISGNKFSTEGDTVVHFGGTLVIDVIEITTTTIRCTAPPCAALNAWVEMAVTTDGGTAVLTEGYYCTPTFRRGDANCDSFIDLSDAVVILHYLFILNSPLEEPQCLDALDVNDDGFLDISDCVYLLYFTSYDITVPIEPYSALGIDPTDDTLGCAAQCGS